MDGNKRTGAIAAVYFLENNGCTLEMDDDEMIEVGIAMADQRLSRAEVFEKVSKHIVRLSF